MRPGCVSRSRLFRRPNSRADPSVYTHSSEGRFSILESHLRDLIAMGQARDHESFDQRDALTHVKQLSDRILVEVQGVARRVDEGKVRAPGPFLRSIPPVEREELMNGRLCVRTGPALGDALVPLVPARRPLVDHPLDARILKAILVVGVRWRRCRSRRTRRRSDRQAEEGGRPVGAGEKVDLDTWRMRTCRTRERRVRHCWALATRLFAWFSLFLSSLASAHTYRFVKKDGESC